MTSNQRPARRNGQKLALSVILGVTLIPLSAVGAVFLTNHEPEVSATSDTEVGVTQVSPTLAQIVYSDVEATPEDLAYACGEGGMDLVEAETDGTIDGLQQSALDALRGICEGQGMPLPGKAAPPPLVETRTVIVGAVSAPTSTDAPQTTSTIEREESEFENEDEEHEHETEAIDDEETSKAPETSADRYYSVHDQAVVEIEYAIAMGGSNEKINEALKKLGEAEQNAQRGDFKEATTQAYEAIGKAREAIGEDDH
ncbi:MAG: hypothetical protein WBM90_08695 [Acidimicrobiia bacterium]